MEIKETILKNFDLKLEIKFDDLDEKEDFKNSSYWSKWGWIMEELQMYRIVQPEEIGSLTDKLIISNDLDKITYESEIWLLNSVLDETKTLLEEKPIIFTHWNNL